MRVIVTDGLLNAIDRCAEAVEDEARRFKLSEEYEKQSENIKLIVDRSLEGQLQDVSVIRGWLERARAEKK